MSRTFIRQGVSLATGLALLAAGFFGGVYFSGTRVEAQRPFPDAAWTSWGLAIPENGAAVIRDQEGRAYLLTADGQVGQLSIGREPREANPLRPR